MNAYQITEALRELVLYQTDPAEWGTFDVLTWAEAGVHGRAGAAGFVLQDRYTGRQFVVGVRERDRGA